MKKSEAGNAFRNCLIARNDITSYDVLLKYSFSTNNAIINGNMLSLCCDNSQCTISKTWPCPSNQHSFTCRMFFKNVVCESVDLCRGIIGEQAITKNESFYESACPINSTNRDQFALAGHLISNDLSHVQGLSEGYALYNCFSDYCLQGYCDWDNGGWLCCNLGSVTDICYMQWPAPWPGPANKNPFTAIPTITTVVPTTIPSHTGTTTVTTTRIATSTLPTHTFIKSSSNHLLEEIAIPVGTVTGTGLVSGLSSYVDN